MNKFECLLPYTVLPNNIFLWYLKNEQIIKKRHFKRFTNFHVSWDTLYISKKLYYKDELDVSRTVMIAKTYSVPTKRCENGQEEKCFEYTVPNEEVVSFSISPGVGFFLHLTTFIQDIEKKKFKKRN